MEDKKFNRLGVIISQDAFQRKLDEAYRDINNVCGIAVDIIICGETPEEHDQALANMLEASRRNNIGLNTEKMQFKQKAVNFYGQKITYQGIQSAEDKLHANKSPENSKELLTILGLINYLEGFSVRLADLIAPLRGLTKKGVHFR